MFPKEELRETLRFEGNQINWFSEGPATKLFVIKHKCTATLLCRRFAMLHALKLLAGNKYNYC